MQEYNEHKRKQNSSILPIFFMIIAFGLVVSSFLLPWWTAKIDVETDEGSGTLELNFYLRELEVSVAAEGEKHAVKADYSELEDSAPNKVHFMNITFYLMVSALLIGITSLLIIPSILLGKISIEWKAVLAIFVFLLLFAAICFAYYWPIANDKDSETSTSSEYTFKTKETEGNKFWGSGRVTYEGGSLEAKWGPTYGWFLLFVASLFGIGALYYTKSPQLISQKKEEIKEKPLTEAEKLETLKLRLTEEKIVEGTDVEESIPLEERVGNIIQDKFVEGGITEDTYNVLKSEIDEYKKLKHQVEKEMTITSYENMLKELRQRYVDKKISEEDYKKLKGKIERLKKIETEIRNAEV